MAFRALALHPSEWRNCGMCVVDIQKDGATIKKNSFLVTVYEKTLLQSVFFLPMSSYPSEGFVSGEIPRQFYSYLRPPHPENI